MPQGDRRQRQCTRETLRREVHDQSAIAHGVSKHIGSVERKLADLRCGRRRSSGSPDMIIKGSIGGPDGDQCLDPDPQRCTIARCSALRPRAHGIVGGVRRRRREGGAWQNSASGKVAAVANTRRISKKNDSQ
jgi:urease alpha subunit